MEDLGKTYWQEKPPEVEIKESFVFVAENIKKEEVGYSANYKKYKTAEYIIKQQEDIKTQILEIQEAQVESFEEEIEDKENE